MLGRIGQIFRSWRLRRRRARSDLTGFPKPLGYAPGAEPESPAPSRGAAVQRQPERQTERAGAAWARQLAGRRALGAARKRIGHARSISISEPRPVARVLALAAPREVPAAPLPLVGAPTEPERDGETSLDEAWETLWTLRGTRRKPGTEPAPPTSTVRPAAVQRKQPQPATPQQRPPLPPRELLRRRGRVQEIGYAPTTLTEPPALEPTTPPPGAELPQLAETGPAQRADAKERAAPAARMPAEQPSSRDVVARRTGIEPPEPRAVSDEERPDVEPPTRRAAPGEIEQETATPFAAPAVRQESPAPPRAPKTVKAVDHEPPIARQEASVPPRAPEAAQPEEREPPAVRREIPAPPRPTEAAQPAEPEPPIVRPETYAPERPPESTQPAKAEPPTVRRETPAPPRPTKAVRPKEPEPPTVVPLAAPKGSDVQRTPAPPLEPERPADVKAAPVPQEIERPSSARPLTHRLLDRLTRWLPRRRATPERSTSPTAADEGARQTDRQPTGPQAPPVRSRPLTPPRRPTPLDVGADDTPPRPPPERPAMPVAERTDATPPVSLTRPAETMRDTEAEGLSAAATEPTAVPREEPAPSPLQPTAQEPAPSPQPIAQGPGSGPQPTVSRLPEPSSRARSPAVEPGSSVIEREAKTAPVRASDRGPAASVPPLPEAATTEIAGPRATREPDGLPAATPPPVGPLVRRVPPARPRGESPRVVQRAVRDALDSRGVRPGVDLRQALQPALVPMIVQTAQAETGAASVEQREAEPGERETENVDEIAREVYRIIRHRLEIERERERGRR